jgi:predicted enzyme related to lactoylglutathione lyase
MADPLESDPLTILRRPVVPLDPDPAFASRLRARLARALSARNTAEGEAMTATITEPTTAVTLIPYLAVHDARAALDWYVDALGARVVGEPIVMPDDRVGHAELELQGHAFYLSDEHPEIDVIGPQTRGGTTVTLHLTVDSADRTIDDAVSHGATLDRPPADQPYGRTGTIRDPFGHRWMIQSPVLAKEFTPGPAAGDIAFFSLHVPDAEVARQFYAAVLGWEYGSSGSATDFDLISNISLPAGIWDGGAIAGVPNPGVHVIRRVDDVEAAVAQVRVLGGTATDAERTPYGFRARCQDNQGNGFSVLEVERDSARPEENGSRAGDISYVTIAVEDEQLAADFYSGLFGWEFTPGHVERGLQVTGPQPMTGFWGGTGRQNITLMYRVEDVRAAVDAVRANGGTATDPEQQPYGITSECTDNQGMAFYLGQM